MPKSFLAMTSCYLCLIVTTPESAEVQGVMNALVNSISFYYFFLIVEPHIYRCGMTTVRTAYYIKNLARYGLYALFFHVREEGIS